jgi:hypothetical protein
MKKIQFFLIGGPFNKCLEEGNRRLLPGETWHQKLIEDHGAWKRSIVLEYEAIPDDDEERFFQTLKFKGRRVSGEVIPLTDELYDRIKLLRRDDG